jgi:hypothetical protein
VVQDSVPQACNTAGHPGFDCWKSGALKARLASVVRFSTRHALSVIAIAAVFAVICGAYVIRHFAININQYISIWTYLTG